MTVAAEVEAEIARLHHAEHWKVGTIAAQLGVHEDVVRRVLGLLRPRADGQSGAAPGRAVSSISSMRRCSSIRACDRRGSRHAQRSAAFAAARVPCAASS